MSKRAASGVSVTFTPVYKGRFLFVQRDAADSVLGGYWCFPGGKVEVGETLAAAMRRELAEETGLAPTGRAFFVDSYLLGDRVGAHFAVEVTDDAVVLQELQDARWVGSTKELADFLPRIAGIDNHLFYIENRLAAAAHHAWQSLDEFDHVESGFLNQ